MTTAARLSSTARSGQSAVLAGRSSPSAAAEV
jgi:hypothetical protein